MAGVLYVMGSTADVPRDGQIASGHYPHQEHSLFVKLCCADVATHDDVLPDSPAARDALVGQGLLNWALAAHVMPRLSTYRFVMASGEDIGVPVALALESSRAPTRLGILTHGFIGHDAYLIKHLSRSRRVTWHCLSSQIAKWLTQGIGVAKEHVSSVGWSVDTAFFRPSPLDVHRPLIVSAGLANRDYETLISATADLEVEVAIAADSPWTKRLPTFRPDQCPPNVTMRSWQSYEALRALYASALLVVVPTYPGPFASGYSVILEAMACGRMVIATDTDGRSDFITAATGRYVAPCDPASLRNTLMWALAHRAEVAAMGKQARRRVLRHFSHLRFCSRLSHAAGCAL